MGGLEKRSLTPYLHLIYREVSFFLGEAKTSSIPVPDYVSLMKIAANVYSAFFSGDADSVLRSVERLEGRYLKMPSPSWER